MTSFKILRGVAQLVSAPALGAGGHKFESCYPDRKRVTDFQPLSLFFFNGSLSDLPLVGSVDHNAKHQHFSSNVTESLMMCAKFQMS